MSQDTVVTVLPSTGRTRFLDACYRRQPDATAVWFMRQAGRSFAQYRQLRKKYGILEIAQTPELSTQVTLMPVYTFGVDGVVLYADIMLPLQGMGVSLEMEPEVGPIIDNPIRTMKDVEALRVLDAQETVPSVLETVHMVRRELAGKQAVIGFSGAPFPLACYMIEGRPSPNDELAKSLMYGQPGVWQALMDKLTAVVSNSLLAQLKAGADVVQVFERWIGAVSPRVYRRLVQPSLKRIFAAMKEAGSPSLHFGTGTAAVFEVMTEAGGDVIRVDWRVDLDEA